MSYAFTCSECGREMRTDERHIGRKVRCPGCATLLIIPAPDESVTDEPIADVSPASADAETMADDEIVDLLPVEGSAQPPPLPAREVTDLPQTRVWSPPQAEVAPPEAPPPFPSSRWKERPRPAPKEPPASAPPPKPSHAEHGPLLLRRHRHPEDLIDMTA